MNSPPTAVDRYRRLKAPVRPFVRRNWRDPAIAAMAPGARRLLAICENNSHDLRVNGEERVVARFPGRVERVVDVGVFEGEWTALALRHHPRAQVLCAEPAPDALALIGRRFSGDDRVRIEPTALGPAEGTATLHLSHDHASLNSLVPSDPGRTAPIEVPVRRGDDLLAAAGWDRVDIVKIDTEGHDLEVLRGFRTALKQGRITVVQFEYNTWNIRSRALLADFYDLLAPLGYAVGKVHPDGVDFRPYGFDLENWVGPACVAVLRSRPDVLAALGPGR